MKFEISTVALGEIQVFLTVKLGMFWYCYIYSVSSRFAQYRFQTLLQNLKILLFRSSFNPRPFFCEMGTPKKYQQNYLVDPGANLKLPCVDFSILPVIYTVIKAKSKQTDIVVVVVVAVENNQNKDFKTHMQRHYYGINIIDYVIAIVLGH